MEKEQILNRCHKLLDAYKQWLLGYMKMPEDSSPSFTKDELESRLVYFTLPMSLNYQRDSYKLWESVLNSYNDPVIQKVFDIEFSAQVSQEELRSLLMHYKIALQPNKHIATWQKIAQTIYTNRWTLTDLLTHVDYDFLELKNLIQKDFKSWFPYLSWPKIFNYRSFILQQYGGVSLKNSEFIEIAPDTHVTKCSVILWVITKDEVEKISKEALSERWRNVLYGSWINPIDMHSPLWFWSKNDFQFQLD